MMQGTARDLERYGEYLFKDIDDHLNSNARLRPYRARLLSRIIVTNSLEAHLKPDVPKDVAIFYYVPEADDVLLQCWRVAILEVWAEAILEGRENHPIAGPRTGLLRINWPVHPKLGLLTMVQRDEVHLLGYNVVHYVPGYGYAIWDRKIWRDGKPVAFTSLEQTSPSELYKHTATPLALLE